MLRARICSASSRLITAHSASWPGDIKGVRFRFCICGILPLRGGSAGSPGAGVNNSGAVQGQPRLLPAGEGPPAFLLPGEQFIRDDTEGASDVCGVVSRARLGKQIKDAATVACFAREGARTPICADQPCPGASSRLMTADSASWPTDRSGVRPRLLIVCILSPAAALSGLRRLRGDASRSRTHDRPRHVRLALPYVPRRGIRVQASRVRPLGWRDAQCPACALQGGSVLGTVEWVQVPREVPAGGRGIRVRAYPAPSCLRASQRDAKCPASDRSGRAVPRSGGCRREGGREVLCTSEWVCPSGCEVPGGERGKDTEMRSPPVPSGYRPAGTRIRQKTPT